MFEPKTIAAAVLLAPDAALVECEQREAPVLELVLRDGGDQKARDDKEDVDPDVASR